MNKTTIIIASAILIVFGIIFLPKALSGAEGDYVKDSEVAPDPYAGLSPFEAAFRKYEDDYLRRLKAEGDEQNIKTWKSLSHAGRRRTFVKAMEWLQMVTKGLEDERRIDAVLGR